MNNRPHDRLLNPTLLIVSLGNFMDAFDLFLFNALRSRSLTDLGLQGEELTRAGIEILNWQVIGMFLGGFIWGWLGDRIGRKRAMIGSVLMYSLGSLGCALAGTVPSYAALRFLTGIGLAGELGLGAILVAETLPDSKRNWAVGIFACFSATAIFAANALPEFFSWQWCYAIGGTAGVMLLLVRVFMFESELFKAVRLNNLSHRPIALYFRDVQLLKRWICCIMLFMPQVFATGFLMTLVPEIGQAVGVAAPVKANVALMCYFSGQCTADIMGVIACNIFRKRKPVACFYLVTAALLVVRYLTLDHPTAFQFYICCGCMGLCSYFVLSVFITIEQFGTNVRATMATSALSSTRTTLVLSNLLYLAIHGTGLGVIASIGWVSACVFLLGFAGLMGLRETFHQGMDFVETT
jgi:MFS family permease